jgi:uncharacterized membrane protein YkoI
MRIKRTFLIAGAAALMVAAGDAQATDPGVDQAKAAALKLVPGGSVNAVERDGEKGATWEVEVREPDGSTVDVRLGANYEKVAIDADSEAK